MITSPFTKVFMPEPKNNATREMSSGVAMRPSGICAMSFSCRSGVRRSRSFGVRMIVGAASSLARRRPARAGPFAAFHPGDAKRIPCFLFQHGDCALLLNRHDAKEGKVCSRITRI